MTLLLSNEDVEKLLTMADCVDALEAAYRELGQGEAISRPRSDILVPAGQSGLVYGLKSMDGVVPGAGVGAVRINSDVLSWPVRDGYTRREKVPAANGHWVGLILLFSITTGEPLAILPDGVVQRLRVGASSGLASKYLARPEASRVGLFGSGWQAGAQLMAVCAVRKVDSIKVYSPNAEHCQAFAREMENQLGVPVRPVARPAEAADAEIVLCATNSIDPVFQAQWVRPGMHLGSIRHSELEPAAMDLCDVIVVNFGHGAPDHYIHPRLEGKIPEIAEGKGWSKWGNVSWDQLPDLAQLITGQIKGRTTPKQVTYFANNIGLGLQFAAAGARLLQRAREQGAGRELPTEWFTQTVHP